MRLHDALLLCPLLACACDHPERAPPVLRPACGPHLRGHSTQRVAFNHADEAEALPPALGRLLASQIVLALPALDPHCALRREFVGRVGPVSKTDGKAVRALRAGVLLLGLLPARAILALIVLRHTLLPYHLQSALYGACEILRRCSVSPGSRVGGCWPALSRKAIRCRSLQSCGVPR
jgi:hypothetical protein